MSQEQLPQERSREDIMKAQQEIFDKRKTPEYSKLFSDSYDADFDRDTEKWKELSTKLDVINEQIRLEHKNFLDSLTPQEQMFYNEEQAKHIASNVQECLREIVHLPDNQIIEVQYVENSGDDFSSSHNEKLTVGEIWSELVVIQKQCEKGLTFQDISKLDENKFFHHLDNFGGSGHRIYIQPNEETAVIRDSAVDNEVKVAEKRYDSLLLKADPRGSDEVKPTDSDFEKALKEMESARAVRNDYYDQLVDLRQERSKQ